MTPDDVRRMEADQILTAAPKERTTGRMWTLRRFVTESNHIEGIDRVRAGEVEAHERLLARLDITVDDLVEFVAVIQPDAQLRSVEGLNVRVGDHIAPRGGPAIEPALRAILGDMHLRTPYETHVAYETLHPFTDGNGRSGRALWLWQMESRVRGSGLSLGFLHRFYYQALRRVSRGVPDSTHRAPLPNGRISADEDVAMTDHAAQHVNNGTGRCARCSADLAIYYHAPCIEPRRPAHDTDVATTDAARAREMAR